MTPDELARELAALEHLVPPALDPARLLEMETRTADLEQEAADLRQIVVQRDARIAELLSALEQQDSNVAALQTTQQNREKEWENQRAEWRRKQQYWSSLALSERAHLRTQRTRRIHAAGLAVAGLSICFGFWFAGEKYWTFTHDDQLRMMQTAARDKAEAVAAYRNANKDLAEVVRLRNKIRLAQKGFSQTP